MIKTKKLTIVNWSITIIIFLLFLIWHGAFESPLSKNEVNHFLKTYVEMYPNADAAKVKKFLQEDDGKPVVMVNVIKLHDKPITVKGKNFGNSSQKAISKYMSFVAPYLIKRGSYPMFTGIAVMQSMEHWGIKNAEEWSSGALVRYRSRRVMMQMITDPAFDKFHDAKIAAIEKTISYPTVVGMSAGNVTLIVFLILLTLSLCIQLVINSRKLQ